MFELVTLLFTRIKRTTAYEHGHDLSCMRDIRATSASLSMIDRQGSNLDRVNLLLINRCVRYIALKVTSAHTHNINSSI